MVKREVNNSRLSWKAHTNCTGDLRIKMLNPNEKFLIAASRQSVFPTVTVATSSGQKF
jgi:hypothetical protein